MPQNLRLPLSALLALLALPVISAGCGDDDDTADAGSDTTAGDTGTTGNTTGAATDDSTTTTTDGGGDTNTGSDSGTTDSTDVTGSDSASDTADAGETGDTDNTGDTGTDGDSLGEIKVEAGCDFIDPTACSLPWPSMAFLKPDSTTPTGYRLNFGPKTLPRNRTTSIDPTNWNRADGYNLGVQILFQFEDLDYAALPRQGDDDSYALSQKAESPTLLIDAETGDRVAHFLEPDAVAIAKNAKAGKKVQDVVTFLRPLVPLRENTRYIVALRGLKKLDGSDVQPYPAFRAYRDATPTSIPEVEARRESYEAIFNRLTNFGYDRGTLVTAWEFHTASDESTIGPMLAIRDDAYEFAKAGLDYTIVDCKVATELAGRMPAGSTCESSDNVGDVGFIMTGRFTGPLYLREAGGPSVEYGGRLDYDASGKPKRTGTMQVEFGFTVPKAAVDGTPQGTLVYGHGLLGSKWDYSDLTEALLPFGWVSANLDFMGMAADDRPYLLQDITEISNFANLTDRLHQATVNTLLLHRLMSENLVNDPIIKALGVQIAKDNHAYYGGSQSAIFGGAYCALSADVKRCVLTALGINYSVLLQRSVDFKAFQALFDAGYSSQVDQAIILNLMQAGWEHTESTGYLAHVLQNRLPGSSQSVDMFMLGARHDYQVADITQEMLLRAIQAPQLTPSNYNMWGVAQAVRPFKGSGLIDVDFGNKPSPLANIPPDPAADVEPNPHGRLAELADIMLPVFVDFLATGNIGAVCDGACSPR
jgi:hypothetical protein